MTLAFSLSFSLSIFSFYFFDLWPPLIGYNVESKKKLIATYIYTHTYIANLSLPMALHFDVFSYFKNQGKTITEAN